MVDNQKVNSNKLGGISAIIIGILNIVLIIYVVSTSAAQRFDAAAFFNEFYEKPLALSFAWIVFTITAGLSYAVIPAVSDIIKGVSPNLERTATLFGIAGYTVLGVWAITLARTAPGLAHSFVTGDEMTRTAILAQGLPQIDPDGWFMFGGPAIWLIAVNVLAIKGKKFNRIHGYAGILLGISHWATVFGALFEFEPLNLFASAGGAIFYPIWFIWLGIIILNRPQKEVQV